MEDTAKLGKKVGVVSILPRPDFDCYGPNPHGVVDYTLIGAQRGMELSIGFTYLILPSPELFLNRTPRNHNELKVELIILSVYLAALPASAIAGGILGGIAGGAQGAIISAFEKDEEEVRKLLDISLDSLGVQTEMRERFITAARVRAGRDLVDVNKMLSDAGGADNLPKNEKELIKSGIINQAGLDSIIIYDAAKIKFFPSKGEYDPLLTFFIDQEAKVYSPGGELLFTASFKCRGEKHRFKDWADNNSRLFHKALDNCYKDITNQAVERIFRP